MHGLLAGLLIAGAAGIAATPVHAQEYPAKAVRVVTSEAGGGTDFVVRVIAQGLSGQLGQPMIVENRGGGVFAGELVSKAAPDGYTLLYYGSTLWLLPMMRSNVPYDTLRDFIPISQGIFVPSILTVHPSLPVKSVKELVAMARARPGEINYGTPTAGTSTHLAAELLRSMTGIRITRIPYKGSGGVLNDLIAGQIQMAFVVTNAVSPHLKSGRLRGLAVSSADPLPQFPNLPTLASTGLPGYECVAVTGMFAPAKTPAAIIDRLHRETVTVLRRADVQERFRALGVEPVGSSPEQFAAKIRAEIALWGKIIREAGIRDE